MIHLSEAFQKFCPVEILDFIAHLNSKKETITSKINFINHLNTLYTLVAIITAPIITIAGFINDYHMGYTVLVAIGATAFISIVLHNIIKYAKKSLLNQNKIALWDVLEFCERKGSLDIDIKNPIPHDIEKLLNENPTIQKII
jgi:hypothetical protein